MPKSEKPGTASPEGEAVGAHPRTALFVVSNIRVGGTRAKPTTEGSVDRVILEWSPHDSPLEVVTWSYRAPG